MIFHEIYGVYYATVAKILALAVEGKLDKETLNACTKDAFGESNLYLLPRLSQLLTPDGATPLRHPPTMPPSTLQLRWLRAIMDDPRMALFGVDTSFLTDVKPLFRQEWIHVYDRYADGDPFTDPTYIAHFQTCLRALRENKPLRLVYLSRNEEKKTFICRPERLQYSEKDDKFRLLATCASRPFNANLARILACREMESYRDSPAPTRKKKSAWVSILISPERNSIERVMLHFAHYKKQAVKQADGKILLRLQYLVEDEIEILIRILSFGPRIQVTGPAPFLALIRERLLAQQDLRNL